MNAKLKWLNFPVAIVGMGISGESAHKLLLTLGVPASEIITFDEKATAAEYQDASKMLKEREPRCLLVSPGFPLATPWVAQFKKNGGQISSELSLALHFLDGERLIGVTGSLGKSTTVSILGAALERISPSSFVGGNLGLPLADYIRLREEGKRQKAEWVVLELSSFQLENIEPLACEVAAITYFTGNHLDRYRNLNEYYETKWSLAAKTKKALVLNKNGGDLWAFAKKHPTKIPQYFTDRNDKPVQHYKFLDAKLIGSHNQDNLAVAAKIAELCEWPGEAFTAMKEFPGLPHRVENLGEFSGIRFINDSKATTMESVQTAVASVYEGLNGSGNLFALIGGRDKYLPWCDLAALSKYKKLKPVFFGECGELAKKESGLSGEYFSKLKELVPELKSMVQKGDTVLLSPGGISYDEFKNFEERGKAFAQWVKENF